MMINIIIMMTRALVLKRSESEDKFSMMQVAITISSDKSGHRHCHICSENLNNNDLDNTQLNQMESLKIKDKR